MIVSLWLIHAINACYQVRNRLRQQDDEFIQMLVDWQTGSNSLFVGSYFLSRIRQLMMLVHEHILAKRTDYTKDLLMTAIRLMCIEILNAHDCIIASHRYSEQHERVFANFMRLVSQHFVAHHDLAFYAGHLNMTTTYLSRIVKKMSGHTVHFISQALASEATVLLKTTDMSVTEIAYRLHFADQASFTKFFVRMKGMSPRLYRKS